MSNGGGYAVANQKVVSTELPQGFFAKAQREVIEVLLNEPKLFERVRPKINAAMFDLPKLKPIVSALFEMLEDQESFSIARLLSRFESVEEGQLVVELADAGERKEKFELRLAGALSAFEEHLSYLERQATEQIDDETEALRQYSSKLSKVNIRMTDI
jgi:hypothetical protein